MKRAAPRIISLLIALGLAAPADAAPVRRSALTDAPGVTLVADLPADPVFEAIGADGRPIALDLGYSFREISVFWMPVWAYEDQGLVMFANAPDGLTMSPVEAYELARIEAVTGRDFAGSYSFPLYRHLWGWGVFALLAALLVWYRRRSARRYAEQGVL